MLAWPGLGDLLDLAALRGRPRPCPALTAAPSAAAGTQPAGSPAHDPYQPTALIIVDLTNPQPFRHRPSLRPPVSPPQPDVLSASSFSCPARSLSPPAHAAQYRHPPSRVPCGSRRPGSRRLHAGHRLASKRVSARLIPGLVGCPGSDATYLVSTHHQRFTLARLPGPRLTRSARLFLIAHHDGLQPTQHEAA